MKKSIILLPILLLSSCKTTLPFNLEEKYYTQENKGLIEITDLTTFEALEEKKESFAIYIYLPGCLTCASFKPILDEFLNQNNLQIYSISYLTIKNKENTLKENIKYTPSVALFYKGKIETYLDATSNEHIEYYKSLDGFTSWFTTYIELKN